MSTPMYTIRNIDLSYLVYFAPNGFEFAHIRAKAKTFKFEEAKSVVTALKPIMRDAFIQKCY